jgi:hypothetical protein
MAAEFGLPAGAAGPVPWHGWLMRAARPDFFTTLLGALVGWSSRPW